MDKRTELLSKFKKIEGELVESLKLTNLEISENENNLEKSEIEKYIKQVKKTRKLFDEYESIAAKIEKLASEKGQKIENSEEIVNLRAPEQQETIVMTEVLPDNKTKVTTKKKTKKSVREF